MGFISATIGVRFGLCDLTIEAVMLNRGSRKSWDNPRYRIDHILERKMRISKRGSRVLYSVRS